MVCIPGLSSVLVCVLGPSLVFEVYPQAIATLPGSTAWALLFFFMVIMLGMDSSVSYTYPTTYK